LPQVGAAPSSLTAEGSVVLIFSLHNPFRSTLLPCSSRHDTSLPLRPTSARWGRESGVFASGEQVRSRGLREANRRRRWDNVINLENGHIFYLWFPVLLGREPVIFISCRKDL